MTNDFLINDNELYCWAKSTKYDNKWVRIGSRDGRHTIVAYVYIENGKYNTSVLNLWGTGNAMIDEQFSSLENAQEFANEKLYAQGFINSNKTCGTYM